MNQLDFINEYQDQYPEGFFYWLSKNQHIWKAFEKKACRRARIRKRYSARTIVEVLRWETDLADTTTEVKLSNNMTPGMARLWMQKYGNTYPKFFSLHHK